MPVSGFKNITVRQEAYDALKAMAEKDHRSMSGEIDFLMEIRNQAKNVTGV